MRSDELEARRLSLLERAAVGCHCHKGNKHRPTCPLHAPGRRGPCKCGACKACQGRIAKQFAKHQRELSAEIERVRRETIAETTNMLRSLRARKRPTPTYT